MTKVLICYITESGKKLGQKIQEKLFQSAVLSRLESGGHNHFFKNAFENYNVIIAIMAVGIVVRGIAKYIKDKTVDPAVIVLDEKGKYAISLLSGHIGGANEITKKIAETIGAQPVITTASDLNNYPAIDSYAKENKYIISDKDLYKKLVMSMLDGKEISVFVEEAESRKFFERNPFVIYNNLEKFRQASFPKIYVGIYKIDEETLHLIPKKLALGIGFHKGIMGDELFNFIEKIFKENSLWLSSVRKIATIDKRQGEKGFEDLAKRLKAKAYYYSEDEIKKIDIFDKSQKVLKYHKVGNISETCAYIASNGGKIIVPKIKGGNVTVCIAQERYL